MGQQIRKFLVRVVIDTLITYTKILERKGSRKRHVKILALLSDSSGYLGQEGQDPFSRQSRSFTESVLLEDNTDRVPVKKRSWTCQNPVYQIRQTSQFCELRVSKKNKSCDVPLKLFFFHWTLSESRRVSKKLQG